LPPPAAAPTKSLGRAEVLRKLHELAFGAALSARIPVEHAKAEPAIAAALAAAAAEPRYAPRRPLLLPQLLQAIGAGDTSRRELADIIARDPSLVGSLLKLANSPFYRASEEPVESIERAIAVMGTQGVRSLVAAALVQPVFRTAGGGAGKFPEVAWEHSYCAGAAAEAHAASVENADPFAAQLLAMVTGLAAIVVFRVAADQYAARGLQNDATALAALLDAHTPAVARRIAATWELSERILEALDDQLPGKPVRPESALGRSLRFGIVAGALLVLRGNDVIDEETGLASLAAAGGSGPKFKPLWARFVRGRSSERAA
jgi:HD-like signal output (HDOD) protein